MTTSFEMPMHNNVECPMCGLGIGFPFNAVNQMLTCPNCKGKFHYDDGFITRIAKLSKVSFESLLLMPFRMGLLQMDTITITPGDITIVRFKKPFYKLNALYLFKPAGLITREYEDDEIVSRPCFVRPNGFIIISSKKHSNSISTPTELSWIAAGSESNEPVPIWHIFIQDAIDLIQKEEYSASIVTAMMAFDAYLGELLASKMREKGFSDEVIRQTVLSERFGRQERETLWLKEFFGRKFTESSLNAELKNVADLRNDIVHPTISKFDETKLTEAVARDALKTIIFSMKWLSNLKLGLLPAS